MLWGMKVVLKGETDLVLTGFEEPGFEVESEGHAHFSALEMFHTSLALCTYSVLAAYAEQLEADTVGLEVRVRWEYYEDPYRVGRIEMDVTWPGVPESRIKAAERAARHCTIHNTLHAPPEVLTVVRP